MIGTLIATTATHYRGFGSTIDTHDPLNRFSGCGGEEVAQTAGTAIAATRKRYFGSCIQSSPMGG